MSSISQMERSSSHTRILPTGATSYPGSSSDVVRSLGRPLRRNDRLECSNALRHRGTPQTKYEHAAFSQFRTGPNLAFVSLHNLIDDGQTQASSTLKLRLEGLENLFHQLAAHARPGIGKVDLTVVAYLLQRDFENPSRTHGADGVLAKIPKYLLDLVAISHRHGLRNVVAAFDPDAGVLGD